MNNIRSIMNRASSQISIRCVPVGPAVTHPRCLQFVIKVSARSFLHETCTYGTLLHPMWDPMSYLSCVPVGPFSISIQPMGPDSLHVTCACGPFSIRLVGFDGLHVTCTYRTLLHPTCWIWRLTCHVYLWDLSLSLSDLWDLTACVSLIAVRV
jgi:hypothetical protein